MTFLEFFRSLTGVGVQPDKVLRLEQFAVSQAEQGFLKAGEPEVDAELLAAHISRERKRVWLAISESLNNGETVANTLDLLI